MNYKKIIFEQGYRYVEGLLKTPSSAIKYLPKWYKDQKTFSNGENNLLKTEKKGPSSGTYKLCIPLVDSMSSGYMLELPADIIVTNKSEDGGYIPFIRWAVDFEVLDGLQTTALGNYPIPTGFSELGFRWVVHWQIKTPNDYSLWITHPSHRHDLPFFTLNGFIDTDKFPVPLFLPFFIKNGFEGIIEEGTPIAQMIPIKRENWKSFEKPYSEQRRINFLNYVKLNIIRTYKNKYWSRKKYE
jgi:hypothetical protein